jgi:ferredoxin
MTRIYVDKNRCEGSRLCVATYPQTFAFGDDGYAYVIEEERTSLTDDELETAITLCPTDAIRRVPRDD